MADIALAEQAWALGFRPQHLCKGQAGTALLPASIWKAKPENYRVNWLPNQTKRSSQREGGRPCCPLSLNTELTTLARLAGQRTLAIHQFPPIPQCWSYRCALLFYTGAGNLNLCPHTYVQGLYIPSHFFSLLIAIPHHCYGLNEV